MKAKPTSGKGGTYEELRGSVDGNESFMRGHQIWKPERQFLRQLPEWMKYDDEVRVFLLRRFSHLNDVCRDGRTDEDRRGCPCTPCWNKSMAERWLYIIHRCFRLGKSSGTVAFEWNEQHQWHITPAMVDVDCQRILLAYVGKRLDNKPRSGRPVGRPKK